MHKTDEHQPSNINRAIIDSTVDMGLKDFDEDPKRSIRKLTEMGRLFNKGRFMDEIYGMVQDLLRNDESPYYTAIEKILRNTDRKHIKDFCINFGYSGLTFGGRRIRSLLPDSDHWIPWQLAVRINTASPDSLSVNELDNLIRQGRPMGIFVYMIRLSGDGSCIHHLCELFRTYGDCAFIIILPDHKLTADQISSIKLATNAMFFFQAEAASTMDNVTSLRKQKLLYGIYAIYDNQNASDWYQNNKASSLVSYSAAPNLLISDEHCTQRTCQRVAKYCRNLRMHPDYPLILFDLIGDCIQINKVISENHANTYLELLENGDIRTATQQISDFRHTISLEHILRIAFPKESE